LRRLAGDAIGDLTGGFAGFFVRAVTFDDKSLPNVRKVQVVIEFGSGPDAASFNAPVLGGYGIDVIRLLSFSKYNWMSSRSVGWFPLTVK